jgi:cellulose synthase/poly-beta-1,6-N-acetylglucosamine synthase-like glycosyltransferase
MRESDTPEGTAEGGLIGKFYFRIFTVLLFAILTVSGAAFAIYMIVTSTNVSMILLALAFLALAVVSGFFNITSARLYYRSYFYRKHIDDITAALAPLRSFPTVAIVVPVYNEDVEMVKKNVQRLKSMDYPKDRIRLYLIDDSTKPDTIGALRDFSASNGIEFIHRNDRSGFKAGAFNNFMRYSKEEYLAIFDADEYLTDCSFLNDLLPYFEDKDVAYVQTRKTSFDGTFFSNSVKLFDDFFFTFIQPARAFNNTAIFAGSCGIIRRSALEKVGGFPEYVVEDTFFSFETDINNYKGLYVPKIYAYGAPITTFTALARQQWRYNYGDTQFLKYAIGKFMSEKVRRNPHISKVDYVTHGFGLNYLSVMLVISTIASILIVFSNFSFAYMSIPQLLRANGMQQTVEIFGFAAFALSLMVPVILTKAYFKSLSRGIMVFVLNFALAVVRFKAAIAAMLGVNPSMHWHRAGADNRHNASFSLFNTSAEICLSSVMLAAGYAAFYYNNITGSLWLAWYGFMYLAATMLIYKYG